MLCLQRIHIFEGSGRLVASTLLHSCVRTQSLRRALLLFAYRDRRHVVLLLFGWLGVCGLVLLVGGASPLQSQVLQDIVLGLGGRLSFRCLILQH